MAKLNKKQIEKLHVHFNIYLENDSEIKGDKLLLYVKPNKDFNNILSSCKGMIVMIPVIQGYLFETKIINILECFDRDIDGYGLKYLIYECELIEELKNEFKDIVNSALCKNCRLIINEK